MVLSGSGSNAATGATAIHHFGVTVVAATPDSSLHPCMPYAAITRDTVTDHVVHLDGVAGLLCTLAHSTPPPRSPRIH